VIKRWRHLKQIVLKVEADPLAKLYTDEALTPVAKEDAAHMELYTQNEAARAAVEREHRVAGHHIASHELMAIRPRGIRTPVTLLASRRAFYLSTEIVTPIGGGKIT
jgi:hypothetical protein